nr:N-acetylmuramoyl-L-alanine amidase [Bacillus massiliigorillae]
MKAVKLLLCLLLAMSTVLTVGLTKSEAATTFKDIGSNHRAYKEITYLGQGDIVTGDGKGNFVPNSIVTRGEAAAMIGRALNLDGTKRATTFKDVSSNNFASGYIQSAVDKKILSGYGDGTFRPYAHVTRGEMAVMISKAFNYSFGNTVSGAANALMSRGIAQGFSNGTFGADKTLIRADFAVFLARSIDYTLRTKPTISFSGTKYVNVDSLNVRKGPSTKYGTISALKNNTKVEIGYKVGTWTLVKSGSIIGFVLDSYLTGNISSGGDGGSSGGNNSLASQVIVIDPGHGGKDSGAVGYNLTEKYVVLDTGLRLQKLLANTPFTVKLTRSTDVFLELSERVTFAKQNKANTFVSIHANAANGNASGSETYYYDTSRAVNPNTADSKLLAEKIQTRLYKAMEHNNRGEKHGDLHVIRENSMPAVLVELGFIDNKSDNAKLASPTYRQKAATAIYQGILDYYKAKGFNVNGLY